MARTQRSSAVLGQGVACGPSSVARMASVQGLRRRRESAGVWVRTSLCENPKDGLLASLRPLDMAVKYFISCLARILLWLKLLHRLGGPW